MADTAGGTVGSPGDDHAAMTVTDQDRVVQVLVLQHGNDVVDVTVEIDVGSEQVGPLAEARQRGGVDLVPFGSQDAGQRLEAPPAVPTAVNQNDRPAIWPRACSVTLHPIATADPVNDGGFVGRCR